MPRLFTGIEIPQSIAERLASLRGGLSGARWVEPENYHVTLRFIGDVDGDVAEDFAAALGEIAHEAFTLTLDGLGSFGHRKPRAVYADITPSAPLQALQRAHERAARAAGMAPETRSFRPHVTLARLKGVKSGAVAQYLETRSSPFGASFPVSRFVLFSSRAGQGGGVYLVEREYPLER